MAKANPVQIHNPDRCRSQSVFRHEFEVTRDVDVIGVSVSNDGNLSAVGEIDDAISTLCIEFVDRLHHILFILRGFIVCRRDNIDDLFRINHGL